MLNDEQKKEIKEWNELYKKELEKLEISHKETIKRHEEIMKMIDKAMEN